MRISRSTVSALAVTALALGSLAACSSDDEPSSSPSPSSSDSSSSSSSASDSASASAGSVTLTAKPYGKAPNMKPMSAADAKKWQKAAEDALKAPAVAGTTAAWVAVSTPKEGFWAAPLGTISTGGAKATLADHSRIGSLSKTFTATAVLEQVAAKKLALADTVEKVDPALAKKFPPTAKLTIEQLLNMTSGLPDYANIKGGAFTEAAKDPSKVWTPDELIASALKAGKVQKPGTPGYSTTNYIILGEILEKVTGQSADKVLTEVASKGGLAQSALTAADDNAMPKPFAHGYQDATGVSDVKKTTGVAVKQGTDFTDTEITSLGWTGGGMYATIGDLFNWAVSGVGSSALPADLAKQRMKLTHKLPEGVSYGLGVMNDPVATEMVGHSGQVLGYTALAMYDPKTGAAIAIMVNSTDGLNGFETGLMPMMKGN